MPLESWGQGPNRIRKKWPKFLAYVSGNALTMFYDVAKEPSRYVIWTYHAAAFAMVYCEIFIGAPPTSSEVTGGQNSTWRNEFETTYKPGLDAAQGAD